MEAKIEFLEKSLTEEKLKSPDIDQIISLIRKYKEPTEITDMMFSELVDKINA